MKIPSFLTLAASAALINSASAIVTMDWVNVGNPGNAADYTTYGAVAYAYQIGKYEVTNAQYTDFLNAADPSGVSPNGIYSSSMGSDARGGITYTAGSASGAKYTLRSNMGDKPVNFVSWYDAARFANWMMNGQGAGSTETGAYTLIGNTGMILKNSGAAVWLPSEDEWYKAAYYDPTSGAGSGDNYWTYATRSDTAPTSAMANGTGGVSNPGANVANYGSGANWNSQNGNVTTVGSAMANNYFGTSDMNGNVWEWNNAVIPSSERGVRGGSYNTSENFLRASERKSFAPTLEASAIGFRLASSSIAAVPEPSGLLTTAALVASSLLLRRRSKNSL